MSRYWLGLLAFVIWIGGSGVARATVTADPTTLDFGTIAVNTTKNAGAILSADVEVDGVSVVLVGCTDFVVRAPTGTVDIGPPDGAGNQVVVIRFQPLTGGDKACTVNINQGSTTLATIPVSGHAGGSDIQVTPAGGQTLDFGHVDVGDTAVAMQVTAKNVGTAPVTILSASVDNSDDFALTSGPTATTTVASGDTVTWDLKCHPAGPDKRTGTFQITSDVEANSADVPLVCTGDLGKLAVTPTNSDFGLVQRGVPQTLQFQLKNTGNVAAGTITGALSVTSKGYTFTPGSVPSSLDPGATAALTVTFAPSANTDGGAATINFTGNWGHSKTTASSLSLNGTPAMVTVTTTPATTPVAIDFGGFRFDAMPTRTYRISNNGPTSIMLNSANVTSDVAPTATGELPTTFTAQALAAGAHLDVTVTAKPASRAGALGGHIDVLTNVAGAALRVNLTGTAQAAAVMAPAMADFGAVDMDAAPSPTQTVTLTSTGNATLDYSIAEMTGGSPAFTFSAPLPGSGSTLAPNAQVTVTVTYHPTIERPQGQSDTAVLIASLAGVIGGPTTQTITLTGRGIDRHISVDAAPTFPPVFRNPGDQAPIRAVTVHNTGDAVLKIQAVMLASEPGGLELLDTGAVDVPARGSQDFRIKFAPTTVGAVTGRLTIMNDDTTTPMASVALTGTCMDRMISFGPQTIDLGFTALGIPIHAADILAVTNMNQQGFEIHGIVLDNESVFHIDNAPEDAALDGGARQTFSITFAPTSIDAFTTTAHLLIDQDPTGEGMDVQLTGRGVFAQVYGGGGGCSSGGGGGGLVFGLLVPALLRRRRRRMRQHAAVAPPPTTRRPRRDTGLIAPIFARPLAALAACVALAAGVEFSGVAHADDIGVTAFDPTPSTTGTAFALQPADVGPDGSWVAHAVVSYASNPLLLESFNGTGERVRSALIAHSTLLQLGGAYALLDRLELGAHFPLYQQSGDTGPTGQPAHGTATGNLALHARLRLWRTSASPGALVVGTSAIAVLPTASKGQFTGSDQLQGRLLLLGSFTPAMLDRRLALSVNAGPVIRSTAAYANIEQRSGVAWGAGGSFRILDGLWATAEVFGESTRTEHRAMMEGAPPPVALTPIEVLAGVTINADRWLAIGVAVGRGVTDAAGSPDLRGVLSLAVVPAAPAPLRAGPEPMRDSDGDGIPDARDKCPHEPEDKDGFQDQDGCPDPDNDGDGIADARDKCPDEAEDKDGFQDDDGCPDPDNDIDGIADAADKCPNQPETVNGFQDDDGCPDEIASTATGPQIKAAETAFAQGRDLMRRGNYIAACAAFEQSQRIDPARGTQYNLAGCYAQVGKLATAWSLFRDLERSDSNEVRRTRSAEEAAALAPRVPRLKLVLKPKVSGVQVHMNGQDVDARIGVEAPVDLGSYALVADAPGYQPWHATVDITDEGKVITVVIDLAPSP